MVDQWSNHFFISLAGYLIKNILVRYLHLKCPYLQYTFYLVYVSKCQWHYLIICSYFSGIFGFDFHFNKEFLSYTFDQITFSIVMFMIWSSLVKIKAKYSGKMKIYTYMVMDVSFNTPTKKQFVNKQILNWDDIPSLCLNVFY